MNYFLYRHFALVALILAAFLLISSGCDKSDEEDTSGAGRVNCIGSNGSGVIVHLYEPQDISSSGSTWAVPEDVPAVGFTYSLARSFIHRRFRDYRTDTTDADGNFRFNALPDGQYIVVADGHTGGTAGLKSDYGWSEPREITVSGGNVDLGEFTLFPDSVRELTTLTSELVIPAGRHWHFSGTFFIGAGGRLILEPGAIVRLDPSRSINVLEGGEIIAEGEPDNPCIFTADVVIDRQAATWGSINFSPGAEPPQFRYCRFEYSGTAVDTRTDGGYIEQCYFYRCIEGVRTSGAEPPYFNRNVVERSGLGFFSGENGGVLIEHSYFRSCDPFSIQFDGLESGRVFCNWFSDGGGSDTAGSATRGVMKLDFVQNLQVHQNTFETSWFALAVNSGVDSTVRIHHNEFNRINNVLDISATPDRGSRSMPRLNWNCMRSIGQFHARVRACHHNDTDIHAENNCWSNTVSVTQLKNNDIEDCVIAPDCPCFLIDPPLPNCGQIEALTDTAAGVCQF